MVAPVRTPFIVVAVWLLFGGLGVSAGPQQPPPHFRSSVEAVVLDESVLDRDGQPIRGLAAADFTILEDGRPHRIDTFSAVDLPDVERVGAAWLRNSPRDARANGELNEGAIFVIVLDDAVMPLAAGLQVQRYARQVIVGLRPKDLAAVVYLVNKRAGQTFTHDLGRAWSRPSNATTGDRPRAAG